MAPQKNYKKQKKEVNRQTKVTTMTIHFYQHELLNDLELNGSEIVRDKLDEFFQTNYPKELNQYKKNMLKAKEL
jgi:hypothetical protein